MALLSMLSLSVTTEPNVTHKSNTIKTRSINYLTVRHGCTHDLQDDQISEDARLELHSHLRLHGRAANKPLHPQTCSRELRHFTVERRPNLEIQLEMVVRTNTSAPELAVHVVHRLLATLVVHLYSGEE